MNLYRMSMGGSDIEPYIVIVTLDENFQGQIVTLAQDTETMSKTVPMTSPYEVTFKPMKDGVWVASSTTKDGKVVSVNTEPLLEWGTYNVTLESGINFQEWLNRGRVEKTFTSLDDVLADEPTVRQLMTVHDSVDYLVTALSNDVDTAEKILDNDICAKWINLRDYALDMLYANANVKAVMDSVDKYGYGEWCLMPQVPTMTSNTTPSGEAFADSSYSADYAAWKAFNGTANSSEDCWHAGSGLTHGEIGYKFSTPKIIKRIEMVNRATTSDSPKDFTFQGYDGSKWVVLGTYTNNNNEKKGHSTYDVDSDVAYESFKLVITSSNSPDNGALNIGALQFYAWGAKGAVPVMTSNTAPYGEVIYGTVLREKYAYSVFDRTPTEWRANNTNSDYIGYKFVNPTKVTMVKYLQNFVSDGVPRMPSFTIYATNNGTDRVNFTDWDKLTNSIPAETAEGEHYYKFDNDNYYLYYVLVIPAGSGTIGLTELQFYGRELKVSVPKMTSNTEPWGEAFGGNGKYQASGDYYCAFNNSNANYCANSEGWLAYDFKKEVLIKYVSVWCYNGDVYNGKIYNIEYSDDKNIWHKVDEIPTKANSVTSKTFEIDHSARYWRITSTTVPTIDIAMYNINFYGVDYSEKEFAQDSKVEYIYDHGVKLKTIETYISNGGTIDEQSDQILWSTNNKNGVTMLGAKVDVTDKKVARARFGLKAYTNASDGNMGFMILNNTLAWNAPFNAVKAADMPNNANVNFASGGYSGEYYVIFGADFTGAFNIYNTLQELWVE